MTSTDKNKQELNKVKAKHGIPVMMGEGDHTWIETVIMDDDQYQQYQKSKDTQVVQTDSS